MFLMDVSYDSDLLLLITTFAKASQAMQESQGTITSKMSLLHVSLRALSLEGTLIPCPMRALRVK